jgi:hypothetical protein
MGKTLEKMESDLIGSPWICTVIMIEQCYSFQRVKLLYSAWVKGLFHFNIGRTLKVTIICLMLLAILQCNNETELPLVHKF